MKTKAAILVEQKKDLIIDEIEIPTVEYGKVLVEIKSTRICGSQLGEIDGVKGEDKYLPHLLGHEAGGIVREVGKGVTRVKEGDHVVCHWRPAPGQSTQCPVYKWGNMSVNAGHITTFCEYSIISESRLTPISKHTSFETAALLADTITTGFGVITNDSAVKIGQSVAVIGIGGIGLGVILGAKIAGANPIIAIDLFDHKLNIAKECGATHTINASNSDMDATIKSIVGNCGVDVMIDGTGNPAIIQQAYNLTKRNGRCVLFGVIPHDKTVELNTLPLHFGRTLTGSEGGASQPEIDIPRYIEMMKNDLFHLKNFVSHRVSLENINEGILRMRNGESIHTMVNF